MTCKPTSIPQPSNRRGRARLINAPSNAGIRKGRPTLSQSLPTTRSWILLVTAFYLLVAAAIDLYYGFTLFFSGAVGLLFAGPGAADLAGKSNSISIDKSSALITVFGSCLLGVATLMIVGAIALSIRKEGSRQRTVLVALLSMVACVLCILNSLTIQWIPLVLSAVVAYVFISDRSLEIYFRHHG